MSRRVPIAGVKCPLCGGAVFVGDQLGRPIGPSDPAKRAEFLKSWPEGKGCKHFPDLPPQPNDPKKPS
jgi:hypothetical protein